jgi:hypothetical protein
MSTVLRPVGLLDVLSSTPAELSGRVPCIHACLRRLASKSGEKSGLRRQRVSVRLEIRDLHGWRPQTGPGLPLSVGLEALAVFAVRLLLGLLGLIEPEYLHGRTPAERSTVRTR